MADGCRPLAGECARREVAAPARSRRSRYSFAEWRATFGLLCALAGERARVLADAAEDFLWA
jgi:hypothetical protein